MNYPYGGKRNKIGHTYPHLTYTQENNTHRLRLKHEGDFSPFYGTKDETYGFAHT